MFKIFIINEKMDENQVKNHCIISVSGLMDYPILILLKNQQKMKKKFD